MSRRKKTLPGAVWNVECSLAMRLAQTVVYLIAILVAGELFSVTFCTGWYVKPERMKNSLPSINLSLTVVDHRRKSRYQKVGLLRAQSGFCGKLALGDGWETRCHIKQLKSE